MPALVLGLLGIATVAVAVELRFRSAITGRLAATERRLAALMAHVGMPDDAVDLTDVTALVARGRTVEAVTLYRRLTGAGLVGAKNAVDDLARRHRDQTGEA